MGKKVVYAKLHEGFFIPGGVGSPGNMSDTLPSQNKTLENFSMQEDDLGRLILTWTQGRGRIERSCSVAAANVKVAVYEDKDLNAPSKTTPNDAL